MSHGIGRHKRELSIEQFTEEFNPPNTVLLEMDGVLFDSMEALYKGYIALLKGFDIEGDKTEFKSLVGLTAPEFLLSLSDQHGLKGSLTALESKFYKALEPHYNNSLQLMPGINEFLEFAKELGLSIALISALPYNLVKPLLEKTQISVDLLVTADSYKEKAENFLNPYYYAVYALGVDPLETITVAVSNAGIEQSLDAELVTFKMKHQNEGAVIKDKLCIEIHDWKSLQQLFAREI